MFCLIQKLLGTLKCGLELSIGSIMFVILVFLSPVKAVKADVIPLDVFALRDVMTDVQLSPDGKHVAVLVKKSKEGDPVIEVYKTASLEKGDIEKPFRIDADPMEFTSIDWISNTNIVTVLRQKVRNRIEGFNQGVYEYKLATLNTQTKKINELGSETKSVRIVNILPKQTDSVIISVADIYDEGRDRLSEAFRPQSYWEWDLKKGTKKLLIRGKLLLGQIEFDGEGKPWLARGFDLSTDEYVWYHRFSGEKDWNEFYRLSEDSFETFSVAGFDEDKRNILFVIANNNNNKTGLWEFDVKAKQFKELIYRRPDVDIYGVRNHSNQWKYYDRVASVSYAKDRIHRLYFDAEEESIYKQFAEVIPHAYNLNIVSRSFEGDQLIIYNSAPKDPGTYYLFSGGRIINLGGHAPLIDSDDLANVEYLTYEARDGKIIPAYLTTPNSGKPPYPLIVLPHGGPFVQEIIIYDEWAQMLANNGYMVLQPQYRGSLGYGMEFYKSAFIDGGQGGFKMQDDKDDGALYLVKKGLADSKRLAMFGWSYGGYAALVAAARKDQIFQCVIAGAAVTDTQQQVNYYRDYLRGASETEQVNMWDDSISPLSEVSNVNVPMLIVHGDVDQRVPPLHSKKYVKALKEQNKSFKILWLKGADHFYSSLFYNHQYDLYTKMIDYLQNDCGPNGL